MALAPFNLRQVQPPQADLPNEETVDIQGPPEMPKGGALTIDLPDGSVSINFGGLPFQPAGDSEEHSENLSKHLPDTELSGISDTLLKHIRDDIMRQEQRLQDIVKGIDLLGVKLEEPRSEPGEEGISVIRHPLLLEAILRFQANARGEMLPADGPVKVANEGDQSRMMDEDARQLEVDMNHYLTSGAPEYYPDCDRMFFSLGMGGEAYKKVYFHPIKRRPVSETIDRKDLILSEGAVSLESNNRVTHRSRMKPSDVKRMQLAGVWRDVPLGDAFLNGLLVNNVDQALDSISGFQPKMITDPEDMDREIYECYCELDLKGFEHKEDGEATGLALPYRVTIDRDSRQILEIRRWWEEGDETYTRKEVFVEFIFVPAFPGVNLGLLHILGNADRALTAAWRIALDNGMLANFPGGIMARSSGKQQTTTIRVAPGQVAPVDVDGVPLRDAFMPLPYRDVTGGFVNIIQMIEQTSQRLGGTAETAVGEGRNDAPVGTTIALIEQSQKVLNAVHKRMHQAQSKEFSLLKELFKKDPEALWRSNKNPGFDRDVALLQRALENKDIVPKADPNTSSQTLRIQKAIALKQAAQAAPMLYNMRAVEERFLQMIGVEDAAELMNNQPPPPMQGDPALMLDAQAKMLSAQAKLQEVQAKTNISSVEQQTKIALARSKMKEVDTKAVQAQTDAANHAEDRRSKEKLAMIDLAQSELVHKDRLNHDQQKAQTDTAFRAQQSADDRRRHAIDTAMAAQQANTPIEEI
jgi:hypothetical protein